MKFNWLGAKSTEGEEVNELVREGRSERHQAEVRALYNRRDLSGQLVVRIAEVDDDAQEVVRMVVHQGYRVGPGQAGGMRQAHMELMDWTAAACDRLDRGEPAGDTPELAFHMPPEEQIAHACGMLTGFVMLKLWPGKRRKEDFTPKQHEFAEALEDGLRTRVRDYWKEGDAGNTSELHAALVEAAAEARKKLRLTAKQKAALEDIIESSKEVVAAMNRGISPIADAPRNQSKTIH